MNKERIIILALCSLILLMSIKLVLKNNFQENRFELIEDHIIELEQKNKTLETKNDSLSIINKELEKQKDSLELVKKKVQIKYNTIYEKIDHLSNTSLTNSLKDIFSKHNIE